MAVIDDLRQDAAYAVRQLVRAPGFTLVAVLTLAIGIGATAAIFSVLQAVVLRPLPVPDPARLMAVVEVWRGQLGNVSAGNFVDWERSARSFDAMTAVQYSSFTLTGRNEPERVVGAVEHA